MTESPFMIIPDKIFEDHDKTETFIEKKINKMSCEDRDKFLSLSDCRNVENSGYCGRFYTNAMNYGVRISPNFYFMTFETMSLTYSDFSLQGDAALFPQMAMANHSCRPNAEFVDRTDIGQQLLVVIYVIEAGEEININYLPMEDEGTDTKEVRQEFLRRFYGFQCCCKACTLQVCHSHILSWFIGLTSQHHLRMRN